MCINIFFLSNSRFITFNFYFTFLHSRKNKVNMKYGQSWRRVTSGTHHPMPPNGEWKCLMKKKILN